MNGLAQDLADAIVAFADAMAIELDRHLFASMTEHCDVEARDAVAFALPAWAQRNLGLYDQEIAA